MGTRITERQLSRTLLLSTNQNRLEVDKYSKELSTGYKVLDPGDSNYSGTVAQMNDTLEKIEGQKRRVSTAVGYLEHQEAALGDLNDILIRAAEAATQGANETNSQTERFQIAEEVYELREQVVNLANSQYLGRYIFAGAADNAPAFSPDGANAFTSPGDGSAADTNYVYSTNTGSGDTRSVPVTDDLSVQLNESGGGVFQDAIRGLTELARSLEGFDTVWTTTNPPVPDNAQSTAYTFPDDFDEQTQDILSAMDLIEGSRETDVVTTRTNIAGRMRRLQSAESLLELSQTSAKDVLSNLQDADLIESATKLAEAQTALNASYTVTTQLLNITILDYI